MYLIVINLQKPQVDSHCCGPKCGKGVFGAVTVPMGEGTLHCVPCNHAADECPILDRQMPTPMGEVDGRPAYLRKLKATPTFADERMG